MILMPLAVLLIAHAPPPTAACTTAEDVAAMAKVTPYHPEPDALGVRWETKGLTISDSTKVRWPRECPVRLRSWAHGWAITDRGVAVTPSDSKLAIRRDEIPPRDPEPSHPDIAGARFIMSVSLVAGEKRAGLWRERDGRFLLASYQPDRADAPRPILRSRAAVRDLSYLPSPDSFGGRFTLWLQSGPTSFDVVGIGWAEEGLR